MPAPCTTSDADDALLSEQSDIFQATSASWRRGISFAAVVLAVVAAAAFSLSREASSVQGSTGAVTLLEEDVDTGGAACVAPGTNCAEAGCCISGGAKGYQCYEKTKEWGECFDAGNCTPGVHEPEKEGNWDANGVFQKLKWSCKEIGKVSKQACWSYHDDKCPEDRCDVIKKKGCVAKCSTLADVDGCWQSGTCMWTGSACENGCWLVEKKDDCSALDRCQWLHGENKSSCGLACNVHGGEEDCKSASADKCMWDNGQCVDDPCSAQGEDCTKTKCCSLQRGALGMKCVEKMKYWATCMDSFNATEKKDWSGKILGPRAFQKGTPGKDGDRPKLEAGCSWAGQECSETKSCCNEGFNCNTKDETFAGCVKAVTVTTWDTQPVDPPEGWEGTNLGGWRGEYEIQPAPEGEDMSGTTFYCFMAILPDSSEVGLLWKAKENGGGIFGCNASSVYRAWQTNMAGWDTGDAGASVVNTAVFLKVMDYVKEDGLYLNYDWTIKADADCVFLPDRLRAHLWGLRPPANTPMYIKNNGLKGLGNHGFLGAIEVFSKEAIKKFLDNAEDCGHFLGTNSGEDGFFKGCMDAIGVGFMTDAEMFKPNFDPATCLHGQHAAYHPIKFPSHWQRCWDLATGKMCQGVDYDCGDDLDPPVTSMGVR